MFGYRSLSTMDALYQWHSNPSTKSDSIGFLNWLSYASQFNADLPSQKAFNVYYLSLYQEHIYIDCI